MVADDDQFPDNTHEKVSNTLFRIIESSEKGVTISLEGGWGSGKSTVVKFLKDKLERCKDNNTLFLFDAWAHDGDPLRRIFLESRIREIDPCNENDALDELLGEISGRKKTVNVITKKSASKLGGWLSISALLVPAEQLYYRGGHPKPLGGQSF